MKKKVINKVSKKSKKKDLLEYVPYVLLGLLVLCLGIYYFASQKKDFPLIKKTDKIVTNLDETLSENSVWCGTFPLVWNELKENFNGNKNIEFTDGNSFEVNNLNKSYFNKNYLSNSSYYIKSGNINKELKEEITSAIKEKFNETSDILEDFDWTPSKDRYLIYSMLIKKLEFPSKFEKLDKENFKDTKDVEYFGIKKFQDKLSNQVKILYYIDENNFAVELLTKTDDKIILEKGSNKNTFREIYEDIKNKTQEEELGSNDILKIPYLETSLKQEFSQFANKMFINHENDEIIIEKAVQTIKFKLDEEGAKLKSEAGMTFYKSSFDPDAKKLIFNSDFTLFLIEKDVPYLALRVNDISDYQSVK